MAGDERREPSITRHEKRSLMGFAGAYADQTERDYRAFLAASKSGRISARAST